MPQNSGPAWLDETNGAAQINTQQGPQIFVNPIDKSLYAMAGSIRNTAFAGIAIYRSTDNGTTWVVQDLGGSPAFPYIGGVCVYDAANNRIIVAANQEGGGGLTALSLFAFNFATNTWSVIENATGPQSLDIGNIFLRPDNSLVVSYDLNHTNPGGTSNMRVVVYATGVWGSGIDIAAIILGVEPGGAINAAQQPAVMDSTGRIHYIFSINPGTSKDLWYQAFEPNNTLGHSATFPAASVNYQSNWGANVTPSIIIFGDKLITTYTVNGGTQIGFITGTTLSNPTFVISAPGVFASLQMDFSSTPTLLTDGSKIITLMISLTDNTNPPIAFVYWRLAVSYDGGITWTLLDTTAPFFYYFGGGSPLVANTDPTQGDGGMIIGGFSNLKPGNFRIFGFTEGTETITGRPFTQFWNFQDISLLNPALGANLGFAFGTGPMIGGFPAAGIFSLPDPLVQCDVDGRKRCIIDPRKR